MAEENLNDIIPNLTPDQVKIVRAKIKEMVTSFMLIDAQKDLQKDIIQAMKDDLSIPKSVFKNLAKMQYAANLAEKIAQQEEYLAFAQIILGDGGNALEYNDSND